MSAEFKSLREIFREAREAHAPVISPLIAEPPPPEQQPAPEESDHRDRLFAAQLAERLDRALERLLEEIAAEVVGRELLLAPIDVETIVERLLQRYGIERDAPRLEHDGDISIGTLDASLGRRVRAAIDRALR